MIGEGAAGRRRVVIRRYRGDGRRHVYPARAVLVRRPPPQVQAMCHEQLGSGWTHPTDMLAREPLPSLGSPFERCENCWEWMQRHPGARVVAGGAARDPRAPGAFPSPPSRAPGPGAARTETASLASPPGKGGQVRRDLGRACRIVPALERTPPVRQGPEGGSSGGDTRRGCPPARRLRQSRAVRPVRVAPRGAPASRWSPEAPR
ncbi:hypothetical protein [Amycolatopsis rubida]|uniref:Uncharacterized protein n=1 Tax=Amycolatopsis rubida TaxID=112413 RepID=A0A1I5XA55_9PSEU|nr:hypothetical protein [Amycolatopsis rubida]SFQ28855.1 hypothetical protein SAMN05421854_110119 [Amycolatopsis rubida]